MTRDPLIALSHVAVRYRNGALGLEDVSLTVEPGQMVVLSGDNGAGKTTTLRAIGGFLRTEGTRIERGEIRFAGERLHRLEPSATHRRGISLVPERTKIFANLTVGENLDVVKCAASQRRGRRELVLDLFPALSGRLGEAAGRLSGGQQQMLAVGRAMMSDVRLLMIDEVTLGLHSDLHDPIYSAIRQLTTSERAALVVDEDLTPVARRYADAHYRIELGTSGPRESLIRQPSSAVLNNAEAIRP